MNIISFEEFKKTAGYQKFISENGGTGILRVQAFTAYGAVPIADAEITISKDIGNYRVVFFQGKTDSSGIIDNISLPAPVGNSTSIEAPLYTIYDLAAIHVGYESLVYNSLGMFGGIKVIQYVKMTPQVILKGVEQNGN